MPISQRQIYNLSSGFIDLANDLEVDTLEELRKVTNRIIQDPQQNFEARIESFVEQRGNLFEERSNRWAEQALTSAYLSGIESFDREISQISEPRFEGNDIPESQFPNRTLIAGVASAHALDKLSEYPEHIPRYARFENTLKEVVSRSKVPYQRSSVQAYRELSRQAMQPAFINGDTATRVTLSKRILNTFADKGIDTIVFPTGHRMSMNAFAEREARAYMNNVSMQANINRSVERGYDLVRINQYAGPSPMCEPHQGRVYSLSGDSDQYPPFDNALFDGSWEPGSGIGHDYCGHQTTSYVPGVSESISLTDDPEEQAILDQMGEARGNRFIFDKRQEQRRIERQIRKYKRREASSLNKPERDRSKQLVSRWQGRQRDLLDDNTFLRRRYDREQI